MHTANLPKSCHGFSFYCASLFSHSSCCHPFPSSNRGEDEFERQLQLAMLTSQMEAAAAAAKAAAAGATGGKAAGGGKGGAAGGGAGEGSTTAKGRQVRLGYHGSMQSW